jgi:hypothetical protein
VPRGGSEVKYISPAFVVACEIRGKSSFNQPRRQEDIVKHINTRLGPAF